jgi:phosphate transport system permease protein
MSLSLLLVVLLALSALGFHLGRRRSLAGGSIRELHSLPSHYGTYVALWCGTPSLLVVATWLVLQPHVVELAVVGGLPAEYQGLPPDEHGLLLSDIRNLSSGAVASRETDQALLAAADRLNRYRGIGTAALAVLAVSVGILGLALAQRRVTLRFRARNAVERAFSAILAISSTVAILTTIGIVLSLAFESIRFFAEVPVGDFLFGLRWSPQRAASAPSRCSRARCSSRSSPCSSRCRWGSCRRSTSPTTPARGCARSPSRRWRCSPGFRPWSTASSPRSPSPPPCATPVRRSASTSPPRARSPPAW